MDRTQELIEALRTTGYRITPQRIEICRTLAESREHPSPHSLYQQVSAKFPGISQATVYNTLTVLRDLGEVLEVGLGKDQTHYEPHPEPHANLICVRCGSIEDIEDPQLGTLSERLAAKQGLRLKAARMDIYGFCQECQVALKGERIECEDDDGK
jgi:Fur family peroxide stress response transcriptional regulator